MTLRNLLLMTLRYGIYFLMYGRETGQNLVSPNERNPERVISRKERYYEEEGIQDH